jgi:short subunit fatty acids transporter
MDMSRKKVMSSAGVVVIFREGGSTRWAVKGTDVSMVSAAVESEIGWAAMKAVTGARAAGRRRRRAATAMATTR